MMEFELGRCVRLLPVELTNAELLERGDGLAKIHTQLVTLEAEKKAAAEDYKARISRLETDAGALVREIRDKRAFRDVEVVTTLQAEARIVHSVRTDTGEIVGERVAKERELQKEIPFAKNGDDGGNDDEGGPN